MAVLEPIGLEPCEKLVWARIRAGFKSAGEAARAHSWNENTYRSHENGERGIRPKAAEVYALAYGLRPSFFLTGADDLTTTSHIPLLGNIGDRGIIDRTYYFIQKEYRFHAVVPFISHNHVVAYEVDKDTNLIVLRPGDLIISWRMNAFIDKDARKIDGMLCVVGEDKMPTVVRYTRETGREGFINCELPSIVPEQGRSPDFVGPVHVIVPAKQWGKEPA